MVANLVVFMTDC